MAVPIRAAIVIPEIGLALTPITPVMRDETDDEEETEDDDENRAQQIDADLRKEGEDQRQEQGARNGHPDRQVDIGTSPARELTRAAPEVLKAGPERAYDRWQRPKQGDDSRGSHRARRRCRTRTRPGPHWGSCPGSAWSRQRSAE